MLVDSHCHIDFPELAGELPLVLERARIAGVGYVLCVSVNLEDYPAMLTLTQDYENVGATVGVHPNTPYCKASEPDAQFLSGLAADARVVGVGETGLDYYRSKGELSWQQDRFVHHIDAAKKVGKPLIIHSRAARADTIRLMRAEKAGDAGGVMHCFAEDWDTARAALDLGFFISFSGILTFKSARELREVALKVPLERMLVETDAPYLAPEPHRGKTNEPAFVSYTAKFLADLLGLSLEELGDITTENFFKLFSAAKRPPG